MEKTYFHVDLDAFFASVEQTDHPELAGLPVVIGAAPGHRGVVAACSYEARKYGIHSAMPISEAYRRCPQAVYLPVRMKRYQEMSRRVMSIFGAFTPEVRQISVDEASLDMTGTDRLFGPPEKAGREVKDRVKRNTGLTISVGIAPNRYLAKLASEFGKPDGLVEVPPGGEIEFLDHLELKDLWGLGKKTLERVTALGIRNIPELRARSIDDLRTRLGEGAGDYLYRICRGVDPGIYRTERKSHSVSSELTFEADTSDEQRIRRVILDLSHHVMFRLIEEHAAAKTVFIKLRYGDFRTITAQAPLSSPPVAAEEIDRAAMKLFRSRWSGAPVRLIGVGISAPTDLPRQPRQGHLFEDSEGPLAGEAPEGKPDGVEPSRLKRQRLEEAVHRIRLQGKPVTKASLLEEKRRSDE